jgi:hypothetical protein
MSKIDLEKLAEDCRKENREAKEYMRLHPKEYEGVTLIFPSSITIEGVTICLD